MNDFLPTQRMVESFNPTQKSPWARARIWLWVLASIAAILMAITSKTSGNPGALGLAFLFAFTLAFDFAFRRQTRRDRAPVLLTPEGIESFNFWGKEKSYRWKDIASASIEPIGNGNALQLEIFPGVDSSAGSWLGRRRRPFIPLARYSAPEQERLLEVIIEHLRNAHPGVIATNTLTQERQFREKLIALAPRTWMTYALVSANVAVWMLMVFQGADIFKPPVEVLLNWGGNAASEVQRGQWWRMVSSTFLHSGIVHLTMNMVGLWIIGQTVERIYGYRPYLMIYLGSAITGSALSLHFSAQKAVSVGASGAVFGIAGALLVAVYQHRNTLPKIFGKQNLTGIGFFVLYSLVQGLTHSGIDNGAHIGGLLAGAVMAYILPKRFDLPHYAAAIKSRSVAALAAAVCLSASIALSAPTAQLDLQRLLAGAAAMNRGVKGFDEATNLMRKLEGQVKSGQMTELELDSKTRTVLAPVYRKVLADLSQAWLAPEDPRHEFLQELKHLTALLIEGLAMESVVEEETSHISPADPIRAKILNAETQASYKRLFLTGEKLKVIAKNFKK